MRRAKTIIAMVLTSGVFLRVLHSMINLHVSPSREYTMEKLPSISMATTIASKDHKSTEQYQIPKLSVPTQSTPEVLQPVSISKAFRKDFPESSAFWNRKLQFSLRNLDALGNLTRRDSNGSQCQAESIESLRVNIQDFRTYPELYQYFLQSMDCRHSQLLIDQASKCTSVNTESNVFLLFAVKSSPGNFERRQAVRETWGKEGVYQGRLLVRTVFLLGSSSVNNPDLQKLIRFEAREFGDLLVWDFYDSFYNLTLKEHVFFKWAVHRCSRVSFIFKGDDDVFANTPAILSFLQSLEAEKAATLYTGQIISNAGPLRDAKVKYYVPMTFYEGPYPSYAGGGGFLFSGALLKPLFLMSKYIPFFPIDDVYTGMCFKALGISPKQHEGFQTFDVRMQDRENACVHKNLLLIHRRDPQQTIRLWRNMHSPMLKC